MRLSFMTFVCPEYTLAQVIAAAKEFGYDGVEPRVTADHKHGIEPDADGSTIAAARKAFADAGIEIACVATSCRFANADPAARARNRDNLKAHVQLAAGLGAKRIRVFGGRRDEGLSLEDTVKIAAEDLLSCADFASDHGVLICLETHDDFSLGKTVGQVLQAADHPAVQATWDLQHPARAGEDVDETVRWLTGRIRHVHCHDDVNGKAVLPGDGGLPMTRQIEALRAQGFDGFLSAELWPEVGSPEYILRNYRDRIQRLLSG